MPGGSGGGASSCWQLQVPASLPAVPSAEQRCFNALASLAPFVAFGALWARPQGGALRPHWAFLGAEHAKEWGRAQQPELLSSAKDALSTAGRSR